VIMVVTVVVVVVVVHCHHFEADHDAEIASG
jgi:hypothetical protein